MEIFNWYRIFWCIRDPFNFSQNWRNKLLYYRTYQNSHVYETSFLWSKWKWAKRGPIYMGNYSNFTFSSSTTASQHLHHQGENDQTCCTGSTSSGGCCKPHCPDRSRSFFRTDRGHETHHRSSSSNAPKIHRTEPGCPGRRPRSKVPGSQDMPTCRCTSSKRRNDCCE